MSGALRRDDRPRAAFARLAVSTACDDRVSGQSAHRHKERPSRDLKDGTYSFHTCSVSSFFKARNVVCHAIVPGSKMHK